MPCKVDIDFSTSTVTIPQEVLDIYPDLVVEIVDGTKVKVSGVCLATLASEDFAKIFPKGSIFYRESDTVINPKLNHPIVADGYTDCEILTVVRGEEGARLLSPHSEPYEALTDPFGLGIELDLIETIRLNTLNGVTDFTALTDAFISIYNRVGATFDNSDINPLLSNGSLELQDFINNMLDETYVFDLPRPTEEIIDKMVEYSEEDYVRYVEIFEDKKLKRLKKIDGAVTDNCYDGGSSIDLACLLSNFNRADMLSGGLNNVRTITTPIGVKIIINVPLDGFASTDMVSLQIEHEADDYNDGLIANIVYELGCIFNLSSVRTFSHRELERRFPKSIFILNHSVLNGGLGILNKILDLIKRDSEHTIGPGETFTKGVFSMPIPRDIRYRPDREVVSHLHKDLIDVITSIRAVQGLPYGVVRDIRKATKLTTILLGSQQTSKDGTMWHGASLIGGVLTIRAPYLSMLADANFSISEVHTNLFVAPYIVEKSIPATLNSEVFFDGSILQTDGSQDTLRYLGLFKKINMARSSSELYQILTRGLGVKVLNLSNISENMKYVLHTLISSSPGLAIPPNGYAPVRDGGLFTSVGETLLRGYVPTNIISVRESEPMDIAMLMGSPELTYVSPASLQRVANFYQMLKIFLREEIMPLTLGHYVYNEIQHALEEAGKRIYGIIHRDLVEIFTGGSVVVYTSLKGGSRAFRVTLNNITLIRELTYDFRKRLILGQSAYTKIIVTVTKNGTIVPTLIAREPTRSRIETNAFIDGTILRARIAYVNPSSSSIWDYEYDLGLTLRRDDGSRVSLKKSIVDKSSVRVISDNPFIQSDPPKPPAYVKYDILPDGNGGATVSYGAYDEDDIDITDQFFTATVGDGFIHKDLEV